MQFLYRVRGACGSARGGVVRFYQLPIKVIRESEMLSLRFFLTGRDVAFF